MAGPRYPPGADRRSVGSIPGHVDQAGGNRRLRNHGIGHRRVRGGQRLRGGAPLAPAVDRRRHAGRPGEVPGPGGGEGPDGGEGPRRRSRPGQHHLRPRGAGRVRPRPRVDRRGPGHQEAPVQRAGPDLQGRGHPRHQHPAPAMALVELVRPLTASEETMAAARGFAEGCGKQPVEVKDQAGFIVNALLFPYLNNAVRLLEGGVASKEDIDTAMKGGCGFPMGPFALLDLVGLDVSLAILDALYNEFRDPNYAAVPLLRRMVAAEQLGRKTGAGFYDYKKK